MFRRFWPKIRVYGNHRHGCSFQAIINFIVWNDVELVGLQNCYLRFWKLWKFPKISITFNIFFPFFTIFPLKITIFKKSYKIIEDSGWYICAQNFKWISSKMAEIWHKTCQKQVLFTSFRTLPWFSEFYFLTDFDAWKSVLGSFFAFFAKIWPINMYRSSKSRIVFCLTFFTWWPDMTLTSIMVAKHSKWYLQMSETLSMPISCLCLCLTSQFCSPMSPSKKCRTFWLWPDLWRHSWPRGQ